MMGCSGGLLLGSHRLEHQPALINPSFPSRSAGDRRTAPPSGRAQTEGGGRGSVSVGGAPRLSDPAPHPALIVAFILLFRHGHTPAPGSPLHPAPPAPGGRGAALRHPEPGELRQRGHQRVHGEQLGLLPRQHVQVRLTVSTQ